MAISCPANDSSGICSTMEGSGAGLGIFLQYLGQALPVLLIILALVGIIVAIGMGIAVVIRKSIHSVHTR